MKNITNVPKCKLPNELKIKGQNYGMTLTYSHDHK